MSNIKLQIEDRLWEIVKRSYNSENYSTAILDAIQFIGDIIREKSGLEGDGQQLVGAAFGGENPKIKLNNFSTDTEKNFQKGIESILRGLYSAYRNPRSHSKIEDSEIDAIEIITYINHLLKIIDKSTGKYSVELFMKRLFDEDFVRSKKYADLLVKDVPKNKYFETSIAIFKSKDNGNIHNIKLVWSSLFAKTLVKQKEEIYYLVSNELRFTESLSNITKCIGLFQDDWEKIDEDSRLRVENKLLKTIPKAELNTFGKLNENGIYGTWLTSILKVSLLRYEIADTIFEALKSENQDKLRYILTYFSDYFEFLEDYILTESYKNIFKAQLSNGSKVIYDFVIKNYTENERIEFQSLLLSFIEADSVDDLPF